MQAHKLAVLAVYHGTLTVTQAARKYQVSRQQIYRLLARYREHGPAGLEPQSRSPHTNPKQTSAHVQAQIIAIRTALTAQGLDAGPETIAWHLAQESPTPPPSTSTIRRVLTRAGLITPEPNKRPTSSFVRFEASQPNEMWQSEVSQVLFRLSRWENLDHAEEV